MADKLPPPFTDKQLLFELLRMQQRADPEKRSIKEIADELERQRPATEEQLAEFGGLRQSFMTKIIGEI